MNYIVDLFIEIKAFIEPAILFGRAEEYCITDSLNSTPQVWIQSFSFKTAWLTKAKEPSVRCYLPTPGGWGMKR